LAGEAQPQRPPKAKKPLSVRRLFLKPKPCSIVILLKDAEQSWYPSKLARTAGMSYVHTANLLAELRKYDLVVAERKGKQNTYKLTERGAYFALLLDDLVKKCDSTEAAQKAGVKSGAPAQAPVEPEPLQQKEKPKAEPQPAEKK
jgi:predicted transcriptional regulator